MESVKAAFPSLEVVELVGYGGMGFVYKARQPNLDRMVALKILSPKISADPSFAERFNREARMLARLNHPNIVAVHDFGQAGNFCYLVMEYVDGVNLRQAMKAGRFSPGEALTLVPRICEALQYAHEEGILHRDIKPENILLDTRGRIKIADFGIAKLLGQNQPGLTLTESGIALGTPHYMAPEQLERPQDVDQRADIYSLGVVFYEMLTGELPIGRFAPPSEKTPVDARVDEVVLRSLEKERDKRYRSASEVKTRVDDIRNTPPGIGPGGTAMLRGKVAPKKTTAPSTDTTGQALPPAAQTSPQPDRWSGKAITGAILVGLSLGITIPLLVLFASVSFLIAVPAPAGGSPADLTWKAFILILLPGLVAPLLGLPGTVLGFTALREVREGPDRRKGAAGAVFATLAWPMVVVNLIVFVLLVRLLVKFMVWLAMLLGGPGIAIVPMYALVILPLLIALNWLVISRVWRWVKRRERAKSRLPLALAIGGGLVAAMAITGEIIDPELPGLPGMGRRANVGFALQNRPPWQTSRSVDGVEETLMRWDVQIATGVEASMTIEVLSNNVPVFTAPLAENFYNPRPVNLNESQGVLSWRVFNRDEPVFGQPHWEVTLDQGSGIRTAVQFIPPQPVRIRWEAVKRSYPSDLSRGGFRWEGVMLTGVQDTAGQARPIRADWAVRLKINGRTTGRSREKAATLTFSGQGFRLPFNVPAGHAATFSLVRLEGTNETVYPHLGAYALAPMGETLKGDVRWEAVGIGNIPYSRLNWKVAVETTAGSQATAGGLDTPGAWQWATGPSEPGLTLTPADNRLIVVAARPQESDAQPAVQMCVRITIRPHKLWGIKGGHVGTGNDWTQAAKRFSGTSP